MATITAAPEQDEIDRLETALRIAAAQLQVAADHVDTSSTRELVREWAREALNAAQGRQ